MAYERIIYGGISGSLIVTGSIQTTGGITGSLSGTSSYALTASYALNGGGGGGGSGTSGTSGTSGAGTITGGTANYVSKFSNANTLVTSSIFDNGTTVIVTGSLSGTASFANTSSYALAFNPIPNTNNTYLVYQDGVLKWIPIVASVVGLTAAAFSSDITSNEGLFAVPLLMGFSSSGFTSGSYTYYRWRITESKITPPNANCVQASEFVFQVTGSDASMAGVTVTNPNGNNPVGEGPSNLVDGTTTAKALDLNFVTNGFTDFVFQFSTPKRFDGYRWATANDEEGRDPKSWTIAGSNNGTTWETLHTVSGFNATATRQTYQSAQTYN